MLTTLALSIVARSTTFHFLQTSADKIIQCFLLPAHLNSGLIQTRQCRGCRGALQELTRPSLSPLLTHHQTPSAILISANSTPNKSKSTAIRRAASIWRNSQRLISASSCALPIGRRPCAYSDTASSSFSSSVVRCAESRISCWNPFSSRRRHRCFPFNRHNASQAGVVSLHKIISRIALLFNPPSPRSRSSSASRSSSCKRDN
jgi:hypothetical protein